MTEADMEELQAYRRKDLLGCMERISAEHWGVSWHPGLEHDLYLIVFKGVSADYGMSKIRSPDILRMKQLAELTGAWWVHSEGPGQRSAIALAEAEQQFGKLLAEDAQGKTVSFSVEDVRAAFERSQPSDWTYKPVTLGLVTWYAYVLESLPVISLQYDEEAQSFALRFGDTTVAFVRPAWASPSPSVPSLS